LIRKSVPKNDALGLNMLANRASPQVHSSLMQQQTIHELFPGVGGRMEFVRVMLYLRMPQLRRYDRAAPLSSALVEKLVEAREAVRNG